MILLTLIGLIAGYGTKAAGFSEVALKAAYLHRFAAYVEWPATVEPTATFVIGVVGPAPVVEEMRRATAGLRIDDRRVVTRSVQDPADLDGLRILYVAPGYLTGAGTLISGNEAPLLIVTDEPQGLTSGGIINFVRIGANVRFEASVVAAEARRLRLRSGLLSIAIRIVGQSIGHCCGPVIEPERWVATAKWRSAGAVLADFGAVPLTPGVPRSLDRSLLHATGARAAFS